MQKLMALFWNYMAQYVIYIYILANYLKMKSDSRSIYVKTEIGFLLEFIKMILGCILKMGYLRVI